MYRNLKELHYVLFQKCLIILTKVANTTILPFAGYEMAAVKNNTCWNRIHNLSVKCACIVYKK